MTLPVPFGTVMQLWRRLVEQLQMHTCTMDELQGYISVDIIPN